MRTRQDKSPYTQATAAILAAVVAIWVNVAVAAFAQGEPKMTKVRPHDNGSELQNPGMGWALHYYDNVPSNYGSRLAPNDLLPNWPGLSFIYLRIPWAYIEPEEGQFNWSVVDTPMQRFAERGLEASFRFSCSESWMEWATPKWVADAGAKGYRFRPGDGIIEDGPFWEPDFDDPVFLEKLDRFLAACAVRYDGHPDVAFIEIGSFGVWGEGHTWASTRKAYPNSTIERHIDLHLKHFKKTLVVGMDDFLSRPGTELPWTAGANERGFDLVVPFDWRGRSFDLLAGLWRPKVKKDHGRLLPHRASDDRRVKLGRLAIDPSGGANFDEAKFYSGKAVPGGADFAVTGAGIRQDPVKHPHSLKIRTRWLLTSEQPSTVRPFLHLVDPETGEEVFSPHEEREDADLTRTMAERGLGLRDDSILVQPPPSAYFHAEMGQHFWPNAPVFIESEHYGGSARRGCWGDGSGFLQAIEDYHASYASIHWWPHEFLEKNRELVSQINLRIGYRFRLLEISYPHSLPMGQTFPLQWRWQNAGVAPPYVDCFPTITLKDPDGGIAAVWVDDAANLRELPVDLSDPEPKTFERNFVLPFQLGSGEYQVLVSVGDRLGRPMMALPLDNEDGSRRYRVGLVRVTGDYEVRLLRSEIQGDQLVLMTEWTLHRTQADHAVPFIHLDRGGKLTWAGGMAEASQERMQFDEPGRVRVSLKAPLPVLNPGDTASLWVGLWYPDRMGQESERLVPDQGEEDRRVQMGTLEMGEDGTTWQACW